MKTKPVDSADMSTPTPATYTANLSTGKVVHFREMITADLIFMEKSSLKGKTETERAMSMMERLSTQPGEITYPEIQKLPLRDFRVLSDALADAGGMDDDEEDQSDD